MAASPFPLPIGMLTIMSIGHCRRNSEMFCTNVQLSKIDRKQSLALSDVRRLATMEKVFRMPIDSNSVIGWERRIGVVDTQPKPSD
jgi:hypothetical protein